MASSQRNPRGKRHTRSIVAALLVIAGAAFLSVKASPLATDVSSAFSTDTAAGSVRATAIEIPSPPATEADRRSSPVSVGPTNKVRHVVTAFDTDTPAVANLDPDLLDALTRAASDASGHVRFQINSGWRSAKQQEQLLREAVTKYGSMEEAARWVAPADRSAHVSGDAVDIGPTSAAAWLADHGATYGLCRTYTNEPWHFELRPDAASEGCPASYADPTKDPRLQW